MKLRHTAAWAGFTAAALLATSACGADGATTAAKAVSNADKIMAALARATNRTESLGSAEIRTTTDLGNGTPIAMEGTFSWGDGAAYDAEMDTKSVNMQSVQDSPTIHCLLVDGAYYYNVDPQPTGPLKGKEWMKVDVSAVLGEQAAKSLSNGVGVDPTASLKGLKYASNVDDLGAQTVNGQRTTHYRAVIDKAHMGVYQHAYGDKDTLVGSMTGGANSLTMDIWVGAKDLPVRIRQEAGSLKITMDFEKFGKTVTVKAPPAAKTADFTERLKNATKTH